MCPGKDGHDDDGPPKSAKSDGSTKRGFAKEKSSRRRHRKKRADSNGGVEEEEEGNGEGPESEDSKNEAGNDTCGPSSEDGAFSEHEEDNDVFKDRFKPASRGSSKKDPPNRRRLANLPADIKKHLREFEPRVLDSIPSALPPPLGYYWESRAFPGWHGVSGQSCSMLADIASQGRHRLLHEDPNQRRAFRIFKFGRLLPCEWLLGNSTCIHT